MIPLKLYYLWLKRVLFPNKINFIISIFIILSILYFSLSISNWFIFEANWDVVSKNIHLYTFGSFPDTQSWRPKLWISLIGILSIFTLIGNRRILTSKYLVLIWISLMPIGIYLLGGGWGITPIASRYWGGASLTLILTISSFIFALPLGIILAFCRQSDLSLIKKLSILYINSIRSIPLITVLFFGQLLVPLFLPIGFEINRVLRATLSFSLFVSAYIAEDLRGGLQSIPAAQYEAAEALGLSQIQVIYYVLLPQALAVSIPSLTNQAIGLLQNTSLMSILGLVELFGISRSLLANPEFIGNHLEVYIWLALVYWLVCTIMALIGKNIERHLKYLSKEI